MNGTYLPPAADEIKQFLQRIRTIAVVGLSPKANRPSHRVASAMQAFGYRIVPVRPAVDRILGEAAVDSLERLQQDIDLVNVFRAPRHVDAIVDSCITQRLPAIWLQDGVINTAAAARAQQAGMFVVMDRCIYRDYIELIQPPVARQ